MRKNETEDKPKMGSNSKRNGHPSKPSEKTEVMNAASVTIEPPAGEHLPDEELESAETPEERKKRIDEEEDLLAAEHRSNLKKGLGVSLVLFAGLALSILFFFVIFKLPQVKGWVGNLAKILSPFIYGGIFAYILAPVADRTEWLLCKICKIEDLQQSKKKGVINTVSVVASLLFAALVIYIILMLVIPQLITAVSDAIVTAPKQYDKVVTWLAEILKNNPKALEYVRDASDWIYDKGLDWVRENVIPNLTGYIGGVTGGVVTVLKVIGNLLVGLVVAIYLLITRKRFVKQAHLLCFSLFRRKVAEKIEEEVHFADVTFSGYISGKIMDSLIMFVLTYIGCIIMGTPYPILMSVIVAVTNMIPFYGPFIGLVPCALIIVIFNPVKCLYFAIFNIILQQVDGNIINPLIAGDSTGLNGFWVLFAISVFGGFFGIIGMIIGVPSFAVIYHWARELVHFGLRKRGEDDILEDYLRIYDDRRKKSEKRRKRREWALALKRRLKHEGRKQKQ